MAQDPGTTVSSTGSSAGRLSTPAVPPLLPIDRVFHIQIGTDIFKISGAALNSDSPSYFTQYFSSNRGPLYIDRDPVIFKDIVRHLQGYMLTPRDEEHFVYLYSDAVYYRLLRLRQQLFRHFYVRVGETSYEIPRELFSEAKNKADSKNFFSMGFGSAMGSPLPDDKLFPQLNLDNFDAENPLRPPSMIPPKLARSSRTFDDILQYMEGYEIDVKDDTHRHNLLKDARFYNLRHLSESLTPTHLSTNPYRGNARELLLSLSDFRASNCRIGWVENAAFGWMEYKRAHDVDKEYSDLVVQVDDDGSVVGGGKILLVNRSGLRGMKALKEAAEGRKSEVMSGPSGLELVLRVEVPGECYCVVDGVERSAESLFESTSGPSVAPENGETPGVKKRKLDGTEETQATPLNSSAIPPAPKIPKAFALKRSMWRVKVKGQSVEAPAGASNAAAQQAAAGRRAMILVAVKLEAWSREREYAKGLAWL